MGRRLARLRTDEHTPSRLIQQCQTDPAVSDQSSGFRLIQRFHTGPRRQRVAKHAYRQSPRRQGPPKGTPVLGGTPDLGGQGRELRAEAAFGGRILAPGRPVG
eukprot:3254233-Prymnesium_polylepis.1